MKELFKAKYDKESKIFYARCGKVRTVYADRVFFFTSLDEVKREKERLIKLMDEFNTKAKLRLRMCELIEEWEK